MRYVLFRYILRVATNLMESRFLCMGTPVVELEKVLEWVKDQLALPADSNSWPIERFEALKCRLKACCSVPQIRLGRHRILTTQIVFGYIDLRILKSNALAPFGRLAGCV